jgi:hypothetical protein
MRYIAPVVLALATALAPSRATAQVAAPSRQLELSFNHGLVTLVARGVTVPEIMGEWSRKGGSKVVNAEKMPGGTVTYEFHDMPEAIVLQSLLKSAAGFIAAPRRAGSVGASTIEQVMILAVSRPTSSSVMTMPTQNQNLQSNPVQIQGSPDDDIPPARPNGPQPAPQPQAPGQTPPPPSTQPNLAGVQTSATPGVVIPAPKPGTPIAPGTVIKK